MGEFECKDDTSLWKRIECILTYGGNTSDIALNYFLTLLGLTYATVLTLSVDKIRRAETSRQLQRFAIGSLVFVIAFQIVLCLILGCSGISIIWCAMAGWIMSERRRYRTYVPAMSTNEGQQQQQQQQQQRLEQLGSFVILVDAIAIIYYGVIAETITTVAHICALILGAVLSLLSIQIYDKDVPENSIHDDARQPLMSSTP